MKNFYRMTAMAVCAVMMLAACGNAGARNDKKKGKAATEVAQKNVKELDLKQFNTLVFDTNAEDLKYLGEKPAIVDFTASWCGPCQRITPILEELSAEYADDIIIYKVDIDKERDLAKSFNISSIPAILYIPTDGQKPVMTVGSRGKDRFKDEIKTFFSIE